MGIPNHGRGLSPDPRRVLHDLGVGAAAIRSIEVLSERHGHAIWRVVTAERSCILKWLPDADAEAEVGGYLLLQELGVPTLPLYAHTSQALLLEDLAWSDAWRLAGAADLARPEVGRAVARWYRVFHSAGETLLTRREPPAFLKRETDSLDPDSILATGRALGLSGPVWALAADHIALLKAAIGRLSVTLNYNDFYWTNLALSRRQDSEPEAIVFDYHLLGVGMRYCDCRNVAGALSEDAKRAFWDTYGPLDAREETLDRPLATLYGLHVAARMPVFPRWAEDICQSVIHGDLERELVAAIALAHALVSGIASVSV